MGDNKYKEVRETIQKILKDNPNGLTADALWLLVSGIYPDIFNRKQFNTLLRTMTYRTTLSTTKKSGQPYRYYLSDHHAHQISIKVRKQAKKKNVQKMNVFAWSLQYVFGEVAA